MACVSFVAVGRGTSAMTDVGHRVTGVDEMDTAANPQDGDSTDRLAEVSDTWQSSPLTEPEQVTDPESRSAADHGDTDDSITALEREERRTRRTDH